MVEHFVVQSMSAFKKDEVLAVVVLEKIFLVVDTFVFVTKTAPYHGFIGRRDAFECFFFDDLELFNHRFVDLEVFGTIFAFVEKFSAPDAAKGEQARGLKRGIDQNAGDTAQLFGIKSSHRGADN